MSPNLNTALSASEHLWTQLRDWLPRLSVALVVLLGVVLLGRAVRRLAERFSGRFQRPGNQARRSARMAAGLLSNTLMILGGFLAASIVFPSVNAATLLSTLGLGSVAIGFAFKDIFQNLLSGVLIVLTQPFRVGDQIVIRTVEGTIEEIQIRATVIRTYDNRRVVMPNSDLFTNFVIVNTGFDQRRVTQSFSVPIGTDLDNLEVKLLSALNQLPGIHNSRLPDLRVSSLQGGRLDVSLDYWVTSSRMNQMYTVNDAVLRSVNRVLQQEIGVEALEKLSRGGQGGRGQGGL